VTLAFLSSSFTEGVTTIIFRELSDTTTLEWQLGKNERENGHGPLKNRIAAIFRREALRNSENLRNDQCLGEILTAS
jgi:hypothetical protein